MSKVIMISEVILKDNLYHFMFQINGTNNEKKLFHLSSWILPLMFVRNVHKCLWYVL